MDKNIIAVDLDGTFVNVNTFHKWLKFLFREEIKKLHLVSLIQILKIIFLRYIKQINHSKMKFEILKISENKIDKKQILSFVNSLDTYIHQDILKVVQNKSNITILATAAPFLYAQCIQDKYKFDYIVATPSSNSNNWKENIREEKKRTVLQLIQNHSLPPHIDILYTDHHDDIPLMYLSKLTYLVNTSKESQNKIQSENILFKIF